MIKVSPSLIFDHLFQNFDFQVYKPLIMNMKKKEALRLLFKYAHLSNPSARVGYDTRSIFKRSLTGLNSEFSFS